MLETEEAKQAHSRILDGLKSLQKALPLEILATSLTTGSDNGDDAKDQKKELVAIEQDEEQLTSVDDS
jgi:hypothetical protein